MFEKDAREYAKSTKTGIEIDVSNTVHDWGQKSLSPCERRLFEGIQDRERAREQGFKAGARFGYNKANEWHCPSKGEYPKDEKKVLVLLKDVEEPILDYYRQDGLWNYALKDEVIAWKEIILPEMPKE